MTNDYDVVSVLTDEQQAELKEFDLIFGNEVSNKDIIAYNRSLAKQLGYSVELAKNFENALLKAVEAFGDIPQEPRLIVVSKELAEKLEALSMKPDNLVVQERMLIGDVAKELNNLVPKEASTYTKQRKSKGERKRASRQQRKQWRR